LVTTKSMGGLERRAKAFGGHWKTQKGKRNSIAARAEDVKSQKLCEMEKKRTSALTQRKLSFDNTPAGKKIIIKTSKRHKLRRKRMGGLGSGRRVSLKPYKS